ncbi:DUF3618 domain-containing protein [Paracoccus liaowanqingii]|uniref:DUF3618 domain-containing protein n=1 Tax=Paracoccus liaowanqingii TaxID=2560053 RepID=A0A4Z1BVG2_9RHOB|nr:DUF3618 domain-containing protein [Paracoccus liaowanqingii]TGN42743.1 DUF3618 domain-containing protein [Paracoccus liaowanqingii]
MTHDADNPDHIEREIEKDREALRRTLDDLQSELSLDGLSRRLTGSVRRNGAEWAESAGAAARANPVALGLTGIGLAWMIFGRGHDPVHGFGTSSDDRPVRHDRPATPVPAPAPTPAPTPARAPRPMAQPPGWASDRGQTTDRTTGRTSGIFSGLTTGSSKEHGMTDMAKDKARHLRDRLSEGTEGLGDEARQRIETARRKALDASDAAHRQMAQANRKVARSYDSEPLLFGALALIGGAALGAMLPGTRREDELMGDYRDQLFDEAEAVYHEEKSRVGNAVSAGLDEAKSAASNVVAAAKDELTDDKADKPTSGTAPSGTSATTGSTGASGTTGTPTATGTPKV